MSMTRKLPGTNHQTCLPLGPSLGCFTIWILLLMSVTAVRGDLCTNYTSATLQQAFHGQATPSGGIHAGYYNKDGSAHTLSDCLISCCDTPSCNIVFMHNTTCFLIECNHTHPDACQPITRTGSKFKNTFMIILRPPGAIRLTSSSVSPISSQVPDSESSHFNLADECDPENSQSCYENEECSSTFLGYLCLCTTGYERDPQTHACIAANDENDRSIPLITGITTSKKAGGLSASPAEGTVKDRSCMYGILGECSSEHEECVFKNSRSRMGLCKCEAGYARHPVSGLCRPSAGTTVPMTTVPMTTIPMTTVPMPTNQTTNENQTGSDITAVSTSSPVLSNSVETTIELTSSSSSSSSSSGSITSTAPLPTNSTPDSILPILRGALNSTTSPKPSLSNSTLRPSTTTQVQPLVVSAGGNKEIQLPQNDVTLSAFAIPKKQKGEEEYKYEWTLISHPEGSEIGNMLGKNTATLKLTGLIAGLYTFRVSVSTAGKFGDSLVNVSVKPPDRKNQDPVAVIKPPYQKVKLPNSAVLDGSESTDDDKIVSYKWEEVMGPLSERKISGDKSMLMLNSLSAGNYTFKLTVTDSDNVSNSTTANITVIKETDYPPKANAGSNIVINLPTNHVTLYGNASKDDKGITSYEWIKKSDDKLTADVTGVRTPFLHLSNLEVGDYTFTLKVTDSGGQTSTADVHVFVKPEHNHPPIANAGHDQVVLIPTDSVTLDGGNSTDDLKQITKYSWAQVSGPSTAVVDNADRETASASELKEGTYEFKLTVTDSEGLTGSDTVVVTVKQNVNRPPVANAGGEKTITLPMDLMVFDGSASKDDKGIVSYEWMRDDSSLAAGVILNNSDHQAILQVTNLVSGRYIFTLKVQDAEGLSDQETASIIVKPDPHENDLVELHLQTPITAFKEHTKKNLASKLELLLHKGGDEGVTKVHIEHITEDKTTGHLVVMFHVLSVVKDTHTYKKGTDVVAILKKKLKASSEVLDFQVALVDTVVCQNNCSGHGHCDPYTKQCFCEAFWMENYFRSKILDSESNCDWSILYVIIVLFVIVISLAAMIWGMVCCVRRCRMKPRKRHRYTLLDNFSDEDDHGGGGKPQKIEMLPRGKKQNTSIMVSESDFSSDEETIFVNHKKTNGHVKPLNGLVKPNKNKIRT